jgi:hypothetical protein
VLGPLAALAAVAAQSVAFGLDPEAGRDGGLLDALSVVAIGAAACACLVRSVVGPGARGRFGFLAAVLAFLAVDDAVAVHERFTHFAASTLGVSARGDALFLLPYLPLIALAAIALLACARDAHGDVRALLSTSIALLAASLGFRVAVALLLAAGATADSWQKAVGGAAIHDAELAAWLLLAAGVAAGAARPRAAQRVAVRRRASSSA